MKTIFHFHLIIIISVFLSIDSCKSKKDTTTDSSSYTAPQPVTSSTSSITTNSAGTATAVVIPQNSNTRFVVSFYSTGQGIDGTVHGEFVKFLDSYPKKITYEPKHWGREGETDYCLALSELSSSEQLDFINKAKAILSKSKLVHQKENAQCDHANSPSVPTGVEDDSYRLVVGFYSKGEGIDNKVNDAFVKFLDSYSKKIAYEPTHWGREGEIDYCLKLSELSPVEQDEFVKKAKDLLSKSSLVHVNESAKCVHKH